MSKWGRRGSRWGGIFGKRFMSCSMAETYFGKGQKCPHREFQAWRVRVRLHRGSERGRHREGHVVLAWRAPCYGKCFGNPTREISDCKFSEVKTRHVDMAAFFIFSLLTKPCKDEIAVSGCVCVTGKNRKIWGCCMRRFCEEGFGDQCLELL